MRETDETECLQSTFMYARGAEDLRPRRPRLGGAGGVCAVREGAQRAGATSSSRGWNGSGAHREVADEGLATIRDAGGGRRARGVRVLGAHREGIGDVPGALAPCATQETTRSTLKDILARGPWRRRRGSTGKRTRAAGVHGGGDLGQK